LLFLPHRRSSSSDEDSPTQRPPGSGVPAPSVKRALFGPTDREENLRFASQELKRHRDEASLKWNFDFETDNPLKGRYVWKKETVIAGAASGIVSCAPSLPLGSVRTPPPDGGRDEQVELENRENIAAVVGHPLLVVRGPTVLSTAGSAQLSSLRSSPSSSSFIAATTDSSGGHLTGPPAGSLDDLRTPAPQTLPPPSAAVLVHGERSTEERAAAVEARLSGSSREQQGARPKTKEQKITGKATSTIGT
jgi:hypothetical protein